MEQILKKSGWATIISSIIFAIIGLVLIYSPDTILSIISYVLGIAIIIYGAVKLVSYFVGKKQFDFYNNDLIFGIIAIIAGIIIIIYSQTIASIFRICIGVWIIYSGLVRLQFSFKLQAINRNSWISMLIIAILMILCGIYVVLDSGILIVTVGFIVVIYAIMDIIESFVFMKHVKDIF